QERKALGQFFTSPVVADYMASMLHKPKIKEVKILDAGAGTGILTASTAVRITNYGDSLLNTQIVSYCQHGSLTSYCHSRLSLSVFSRLSPQLQASSSTTHACHCLRSSPAHKQAWIAVPWTRHCNSASRAVARVRRAVLLRMVIYQKRIQ
ncbi:MAG: hypothetical protein RQ714_09470, partial [Nitrosomonas sp.]|nr:hypothetical protein [Nitrosomonas sp.]